MFQVVRWGWGGVNEGADQHELSPHLETLMGVLLQPCVHMHMLCLYNMMCSS